MKNQITEERVGKVQVGLLPAEAEVYSKINWEQSFIPNDLFEQSGAESRFFGPAARKIQEPVWDCLVDDAKDIPLVRNRRTTLTDEEERELFLRYNYAAYRMAAYIEKQLKRETLPRAKEMCIWQKKLQQARSAIAAANMGLVMAMARRTKIPNVDFPELISEGNMALLRSIDKFDVARGFKFSTYACRAILKSFNRLATKTGRYRQFFPTEFEPTLERSDYDVLRHEMRRQDSLESIREIIDTNLADLTETERTVVVERFALNSNEDKGRTLAEVGVKVGLTNERVRQIQLAALNKIRTALDKHYLVA
jgi:RNA polymerase sigma factor (sigma-70 family)